MNLQLNLQTIDKALDRYPALLIVARRDERAFVETLRMQWPGYPLLPTGEDNKLPPVCHMRGVQIVVANIPDTVTVDLDLSIRRVF